MQWSFCISVQVAVFSFTEHTAVTGSVITSFLCNSAYTVNPVNASAADIFFHDQRLLYSVHLAASALRTWCIRNVPQKLSQFSISAFRTLEIITLSHFYSSFFNISSNSSSNSSYSSSRGRLLGLFMPLRKAKKKALSQCGSFIFSSWLSNSFFK